MNEQRYPLQWPLGWKRTASYSRTDSKFRRPVSYAARWHSMEEAASFLNTELDRLGARGAILSTNIEVRLDGRPYSGRAAPQDPGVAVYFTLKGRRLVLACDKYRRAECNVYAIGKHVEALRAQERYGVGTVEQAFAGYAALADSSHRRPWYIVMGTTESSAPHIVEAIYKELCKKLHPDLGGSNEAMAELNAAYDEFRKERGL